MVKGLYTAYTGMVNQQNRMDVLSNNLANASTTGYKKEGSTTQSFDTVLAYKIKDNSEATGSRHIGNMNLGVKIGENYTDYTQGSFRTTENTYDLALSGEGFMAVEFTDKAGNTSTKYTRDGSFTLSKEGYLVTKDGDFVLDSAGKHIKLNPLMESSIDEAGNISQNGTRVATIGIKDFTDYNYLKHYGENYYQTVDGATQKAATAKVQSGYLETSNVQVVKEMVELISVTRAYESNQKLVQTIDGTLDVAANQLGRV